jgi:uncharacterized protein (DUF1697 family)
MPSSGKRPGKTQAFVALMRGINVGGKNMVPMADLVEVFGEAGCVDARTYIQSGNVIFRAEAALAGRLPSCIEQSMTDRFGFGVPVVIRTAEELLRVARNNPFVRAGKDPDALHVAFLAAEPAAKAVAGLDPRRSPPDEFAVRGREIYLHCPNGMARTKLTNQYFDSKLSTTSTVRNWRTVLKLLELATAADPGSRGPA